jgi:hypothetical protein
MSASSPPPGRLREPRPARAALSNRTPWPGRGTYVESRVSSDLGRVFHSFSTASSPADVVFT